jgi:hypothetical protein
MKVARDSPPQLRQRDGNMARGYDIKTSQYHPSLRLLNTISTLPSYVLAAPSIPISEGESKDRLVAIQEIEHLLRRWSLPILQSSP